MWNLNKSILEGRLWQRKVALKSAPAISDENPISILKLSEAVMKPVTSTMSLWSGMMVNFNPPTEKWKWGTYFISSRMSGDASAIGRGPRQKNGKILTELSFFTVFNHKNDLEKVWKSRNKFKVVGFKVEKNGPCSRENEVKISKKRKMAKNLEVRFAFLRCLYGGFGG